MHENRIIKFRAWDGKRFHYWGMELIMEGTFTGSPNPNYIDTQFSGFCDSNGTEIYEGDILDAKYKAVVSFKKGAYVVSNKKNRPTKRPLIEFLRLRIQDVQKCEVVGNVFES